MLEGVTHLVRLVIVLRVVLEHLLFLRVIPVGQDLVQLSLFPPLFALDKHLLGQVDVELAGAEEAQLQSGMLAERSVNLALGSRTHQSNGIQPLSVSLGLEHQPQLVYLGLLRRRQVSRKPGLDLSRGGREVVVIVFGIQLHREVLCRHVV